MIDCQKDLFLLPEGHHYLNCSYLSPLLHSVEQAGIEGIRGKSRPWEVTPDRFFEDSEEVRRLFASIVHCKNPDHIAIMPSVSYGMGTVANNLPQSSGKEVVITGEQFPSNVYPWKRYCERTDNTLRVIDPPAGIERGRNWNERILEAISDKTMLVAIGNVHWTDGTLFNLKKISEKARKHGALLVIDGTQSVGALPFYIDEIQPDALICAGYKWLMGPYGMAFGYFGPNLREGVPLEEGWIVRKNSRDFSGLIDYEGDYQPGAKRYDVGQRSNFITLPMMKEALGQIAVWGVDSVQSYIQNLTKDLIPGLREYGYIIEEDSARSKHMFGIRLPESVNMEKLSREMKEKNIYVSVRGSAIRVSPHLYNSEEDIEIFRELLLNQ